MLKVVENKSMVTSVCFYPFMELVGFGTYAYMTYGLKMLVDIICCDILLAKTFIKMHFVGEYHQ